MKRTASTAALLVLAVDWAAKATFMLLTPGLMAPDWRIYDPLSLPLIALAGVLLVSCVPSRLMSVAVGLAVGGGAGNLLERLADRPVTNFIPLPVLGTCNLADLAMVCSVPLMACAFVLVVHPMAHRLVSHHRTQGVSRGV